MSGREHHYYVYIQGSLEGFTADYKCTRLVWFECFEYIDNAITREKQIKRWRREKKIALIATLRSG